MLVYFDETDQTIKYDTWALNNVAEFRALIEAYGRPAFDAVALLNDYRSFYRHVRERHDREEMVIRFFDSPTIKRKLNFTLTKQKIKMKVFLDAEAKYIELNEDTLWSEYYRLQDFIQLALSIGKDDEEIPDGEKPQERRAREEARLEAFDRSQKKVQDWQKRKEELHRLLFTKADRKNKTGTNIKKALASAQG